MIDLGRLERFVVTAKAATYAAGAPPSASSRPGSHDLRFVEGELSYLDSYFGGTDFLGQEVVYVREEPIWAMNYYGRILAGELLGAAEAGRIVQASLSALYREGRFLGGYAHEVGSDRYVDTNEGDVACFRGLEWIEREGVRAYELVYHGGLVRP